MKEPSIVPVLLEHCLRVHGDPNIAARAVFAAIETIDREQIASALRQELANLRLGRVELTAAIAAHATSYELSALCLGLASLLFKAGDLRCAAFGMRNSFMAKDLQAGALNDRALEKYRKMLDDYEKVATHVLGEQLERISHDRALDKFELDSLDNFQRERLTLAAKAGADVAAGSAGRS